MCSNTTRSDTRRRWQPQGCVGSNSGWASVPRWAENSTHRGSMRQTGSRGTGTPGDHGTSAMVTGCWPGGRSPTPEQIAYYICYGPADTPLAELVRLAGSRWSIEECFQTTKNETGLDHYQVRRYSAWYRHITSRVRTLLAGRNCSCRLPAHLHVAAAAWDTNAAGSGGEIRFRPWSQCWS